MTGLLEIGKFLRRQSVSIFEQLRMRCIKLGSLVVCSRVPQVNFVRKHFVGKQTMRKSVNTHLTVLLFKSRAGFYTTLLAVRKLCSTLITKRVKLLNF